VLLVNQTIGSIMQLGGMLFGTIFSGNSSSPGLYYIFATLQMSRHLIKNEDEVPLTEDLYTLIMALNSIKIHKAYWQQIVWAVRVAKHGITSRKDINSLTPGKTYLKGVKDTTDVTRRTFEN